MTAFSEKVSSIIENIKSFAVCPVSLVAVTKHQSVDLVRKAVEGGIQILGINYAQEGYKLRTEIRTQLDWHFIGHIQSRKVKLLTDYQCIQSLDRIETAQSLDAQLGVIERSISVLLQVNVANESQKSGVSQEKLETLLLAVQKLPHLRIKGLMCLPPPLFPVENRRPYLKTMRQLYDRYRKTFALEWLSMGTSDDYRVAIQEGANMVRLGRCIFGEQVP